MKKHYIMILALFVIAAVCGGMFQYKETERKRLEEEARQKALAELAERMEQEETRMYEMQNTWLERETARRAVLDDPDYKEHLVHTKDLPVTAIGDSVMLGALYLLRNTFPNGNINARQNRSHYELYSMIADDVEAGTLGDPVVIGIGTNGPLPIDLCRNVVELCGERQIFWLTTTNNFQFYNTETIETIGQDYDNVTILDWDHYSDDHPEYFYQDGIHLTWDGQAGYTDFIVNGITDRLYSLIPKEDDERILFIGDGTLLSCTSEMEDVLEAGVMSAAEPFDANRFMQEADALRAMRILPGHVMIAVNDTTSAEELEPLIQNLSDQEVTLIIIRTDRETQSDLSSLSDTFPSLQIHRYETAPEDFAVDERFLSKEGAARFAANLTDLRSQMYD